MVPNIHVIGIQGSGKGTQSALLVKKYKFTYLASGNLFRERSEHRDQLGQAIGESMRAGRLLPDRYLFQTVRQYLAAHQIAVGLLSDGVIRTLAQLEGLESSWERYNLEQPLFICLDLDEQTAAERIEHRTYAKLLPNNRTHHATYSGKLIKREDDNPLAINERFALYHTLTEPVINQLDQAGRCWHIDGSGSVGSIHTKICTFLEERYPELDQTVD